jgi:FKBP-type peptidyl-prolyl cis-trans isomerase SlpA
VTSEPHPHVTPPTEAPAKVQADSFLTLHYRLCGADGVAIVDTFADKPATLSMGSGQLAPAMEARLLGLAEGTQASFELAAGEAFGMRNPELVQRLAWSLMRELGPADAQYAAGEVVSFPAPHGQGSLAGVVREVDDKGICFDFNHPLAGQALRFEVQLLGVM